MQDFAGIYYWIRLGLLGLISLLAFIAAFRLMRTRKFSTGKGIVAVVLELIALVGTWLLTGASPSPVWLIVALALGAVLGFLLGRSAKPAAEEKLKRSPVAATISAIAFIFGAMTLLFGTSYLFSIALLGVALALGLFAGQLAGELQAAKAVMPPEMPPMPAAAPPPMPTAPPMPTESMPAPPPMPGEASAPPQQG
ncbi:MAG: hypothetical protein KJ747_10920 [Actinobacteria bacterium]|nr:hypothetical protein [Actinomycetota bacterium]MCG2808606.1 hypothetical protein [Coriobacteriia bacterium]